MNRQFALLKYIWQIFIILSTAVLAFIIPLSSIFDLTNYIDVTLISIIISLIFALDIFFQLTKYDFFTTQYTFEETKTSIRYLQTWFLLDLLAAIPFVIFQDDSILRFLPLIKLIKVGKILYHWRQTSLKYSSFILLFMLLLGVSHITHWLTCGWISIHGLEANLDKLSNYLRGLYWTVTTLTTVGYGDITPHTNSEILFTMVVEILGVGTYGYIIGSIAYILSKKDPAREHYNENMENLSGLTKYRKLPKELQKKISDYYAYLWKKRLGYDESVFLRNLPPSLKVEVSLHLRQEVVSKIRLFQGASKNFLREVSVNLKSLVLTPDDIVFHEGETGNKMYFVIQGELAILNKNQTEVYTVLKEGDYFGEIAMIKNKPRTATVKALTYCDLYYLDRTSFDGIIKRYPGIISKIEEKISQIENEKRFPDELS